MILASSTSQCHGLVSWFLLGPHQRMLADLYCFQLVYLPVHPSVRGHSNSVILNRIYSKFHIWIDSINLLFKFEYGICPTSNNYDGLQNGCHLSISPVVVTLTQSFLSYFFRNFIYVLLPSTFPSSLNMGFVRHLIIKMADKMAAAYQCPLPWSVLLSHFLWDFFQISCMDCFYQTLVQDRIQVQSNER